MSSSWDAWLALVSNESHGCAILSSLGVRFGTRGNWKATKDEETRIARASRNAEECQTSVPYRGEKYLIVRILDEVFIAVRPQNTLVIGKAKEALFVVHFNRSLCYSNYDGTVSSVVSKELREIVNKLRSVGY
jgi:hypothetical protein